jgi:hypothetical protein
MHSNEESEQTKLHRIAKNVEKAVSDFLIGKPLAELNANQHHASVFV